MLPRRQCIAAIVAVRRKTKLTLSLSFEPHNSPLSSEEAALRVGRHRRPQFVTSLSARQGREVGSGRPYRNQANGGVVQAILGMVTRVEIPRGLSRIKDLRARRS
jgi:hypothetical protein